MFVSKEKYERDISALKYDVARINSLYWELAKKHEILLSHFGLHEKTDPEKTYLVSKGEPERGDKQPE